MYEMYLNVVFNSGIMLSKWKCCPTPVLSIIIAYMKRKNCYERINLENQYCTPWSIYIYSNKRKYLLSHILKWKCMVKNWNWRDVFKIEYKSYRQQNNYMTTFHMDRIYFLIFTQNSLGKITKNKSHIKLILYIRIWFLEI